MIIIVRGFARFGELIGRERRMEVPEGTTLRALLDQLADTSPALAEALFDNERHVRDYVILMRNRQRVERKNAPDIVLDDGDEIAVFPPVAGG
ncbi:MAG: MoaD/ThiS family protein [Methanomicrobiales archaeon]|nr:MoaD/ThiS family protein [Methanomicrobiales archaeon]